jgi:hypothetical protein
MGWFSALAAGIVALSALTGLAGAAPASAATWTYLCVTAPDSAPEPGTQCIYSNGVGDYPVMTAPDSVSDMTNWTYPNANADIGDIKQANTNLCLQVNAAAGGLVIGAECVNDSAEQWVNFYNTETKHTMFLSEYYLGNGEDRCLSGSGPVTDVTECNVDTSNEWYYQWSS